MDSHIHQNHGELGGETAGGGGGERHKRKWKSERARERKSNPRWICHWHDKTRQSFIVSTTLNLPQVGWGRGRRGQRTSLSHWRTCPRVSGSFRARELPTASAAEASRMGTAFVMPTNEVKMLMPRTAASLHNALRNPNAVVLELPEGKEEGRETKPGGYIKILTAHRVPFTGCKVQRHGSYIAV